MLNSMLPSSGKNFTKVFYNGLTKKDSVIKNTINSYKGHTSINYNTKNMCIIQQVEHLFYQLIIVMSYIKLYF